MKALCSSVQRFGPLVARVLIALPFVVAGLGKLAAFPKTAAFMANKDLPMPEVLLVAAIALELGGSVLLILGWKARWVAAALAGFTLVATLIFHAFWAVEPQLVREEINNFLKNLAILGALLYVVAYGAGPLSVGRDDCPGSEPAPAPAPRKRR